jgi:hypothetical protein
MSCGAHQSVAGSGSGHKQGREQVVLRVRPALHTPGAVPAAAARAYRHLRTESSLPTHRGDPQQHTCPANRVRLPTTPLPGCEPIWA